MSSFLNNSIYYDDNDNIKTNTNLNLVNSVYKEDTNTLKIDNNTANNHNVYKEDYYKKDKKQENESEVFEFNNLYIEGFHYKNKISEILEEFNSLNPSFIDFKADKKYENNINKNNNNIDYDDLTHTSISNIKNSNNNSNKLDILYNEVDISTTDMYEKTVEEEIEQLIKTEREKILKKKIFGLFRDSSKIQSSNTLNSNNNLNTKKNKIFSVYSSDKKKNNNDNKDISKDLVKSENYQQYAHLRNEAKVVEESIKKINISNYKEIIKTKFSNCNLLSYHFYRTYYNKKEIGRENNYIFNFNIKKIP